MYRVHVNLGGIIINYATAEVMYKMTHISSSVTDCAEYEPADRQKEQHINEELLPELDDYVVKVAKRRKRLPHTCVNAVSDFSNHQALYMVSGAMSMSWRLSGFSLTVLAGACNLCFRIWSLRAQSLFGA